MKSQLKFSQTRPARHPDGIISSDAKLKGQKSFTPSYEKNPKEYNMYWLLSDEYMRIWFKERADYERFQYAASETLANEKIILRKVIKRKPEKKEKALPEIKLKRFQNIPAKTENKRIKTI